MVSGSALVAFSFPNLSLAVLVIIFYFYFALYFNLNFNHVTDPLPSQISQVTRENESNFFFLRVVVNLCGKAECFS